MQTKSANIKTLDRNLKVFKTAVGLRMCFLAHSILSFENLALFIALILLLINDWDLFSCH